MHGLMLYRHFGRARSLSGTNTRSLHSDRASARARSLRSDQVGRSLGRYVATEQCACAVVA
ncbi:hypothetical protein F2Q70_00010281 [Brassica cretica]|uniref:Uncharacterized protein n=1 Tax=Brassica cretica TaxID=69181 RepID=A0A8S9LQV7_BRACR|nr:hypothetical protein F2Q68_00003315 [Brassica cretica]KAF2609984.1 hypothetical protein F2Q70_00010281 [Brassica cretica]